MASSSKLVSKWFSIEFLEECVTRTISLIPAAIHSLTTYWIRGLSTSGSISFGIAFVAGNIRVPNPATGITAFLTFRFKADIIPLLNYAQFMSFYPLYKTLGVYQLNSSEHYPLLKSGEIRTITQVPGLR
ncbi:protein of unknown function [Serratia sp. Tan611]|nr:protein of unknown function [Serratia sp. Tan611]